MAFARRGGSPRRARLRHHADDDTGGGGGGYVAKAVHFDGSTFLLRSSTLIGVADSPRGTLAGWFKIPANTKSWSTIFLGTGAASSPHFQIISDVDRGDNGLIEVDLDDSTGTNGGSLLSNYGAYPFDVWCLVLQSWKTDELRSGVQLGTTCINRVITANQNIGSNTYSVGYSAQALWCFGSDSGDIPFFVGDVADFRFFPGVSIVETDGTISAANLDLFIDGSKPVDPAIAAAALGDPAVFFGGDSVAFVTNQGTGGAFTLTGALTNATTSPSD